MMSMYWGTIITNELVGVYLKWMLIGLLVMLLFWAVVELSSWGIRTLKNRSAKPLGGSDGGGGRRGWSGSFRISSRTT